MKWAGLCGVSVLAGCGLILGVSEPSLLSPDGGADAPTSASLLFEPPGFDLGVLEVGEERRQFIRVRNVGRLPATGLTIAVEPPYEIEATTCGGALAQGADCQLTILLATPVAGPIAGKLRATSVEASAEADALATGEAALTVELTGFGAGSKVTSDPVGLDCPGTCAASFRVASVRLLAQPAPEHGTRFTGACTGFESCDVALTVAEQTANVELRAPVVNSSRSSAFEAKAVAIDPADGRIVVVDQNCTLYHYDADGNDAGTTSSPITGAECFDLVAGADHKFYVAGSIDPAGTPQKQLLVFEHVVGGASTPIVTYRPTAEQVIGRSIAFDGLGDLVVGGFKGSAATRGAVVGKFSTTGVERWVKTNAAPTAGEGESVYDVAGGPAGEVVALGADGDSRWLRRYDSTGTVVFTATPRGQAELGPDVAVGGVVVDARGHAFVVGTTGDDGTVDEYDPAGNVVLDDLYMTAGTDHISGVGLHASGRLGVTGMTDGSTWMRLYAPFEQPAWSLLKGSGTEFGVDAAFTAEGHVVFLGYDHNQDKILVRKYYR
jgi:hypothetical protein